MDHPAPAPHDYGRVSDPQRFAPLHDAADTLVARLAEEYEVEIRHGDPEAFRRDHGFVVTEVTDVLPSEPGAARLSIAKTDFPGAAVRFGRWHVEAFPRCGCDACDERPEALIEELNRLTGATTTGGFSEALAGRWLTAEFVAGQFRRSRRGKVGRARRRMLGGRGRLDWTAWPERT